MEATTAYGEESRQRFQNRISSAIKMKLTTNGVENAEELSVKFIDMMANGHSKEEVLAELEKYSKADETRDSDVVDRHNKSFVDWLFGYSSVISIHKESSLSNHSSTPLTEADTEIATELKGQQTKTPAIDDITDDEEDKEKDDDDVPELDSDNEAEAAKDETKEEEEKKPELPKRRSFIRIKEGKSGRFTPIKSEDRHSFVKRNLSHAATQLDVANQVQKKMMAHAVAVANASENLTLNKKKSNASIGSTGVEKKKSFRRDSTASNGSSTPSVYSSTNATFIQSFAGKTFPKTATTTTTNINASSVTPDKSKAVRCTYWPNCNRGDECKFWHPKELCPHLNNCPDGDECLYIHPAVPQSQLNKAKNKKKSESTLEISETTKHTLQKKLSKRDSMLSLSSNISQLSKKSSKVSLKDAANAAVTNFAVECKYGANCTRPDCKFSHPSPAAILAAAKKTEALNILKKKESAKLKEKKSHDILKHKESRSSISTEEAQTILCRFDPNCKRENCKFMHTNK